MSTLVAVQISDLYGAMLTAIGTIMIIVGFILLLRQKSSVTREEHMGISITTIGVIIDILISAVRAVSPEYLSSIGIASNIPFIIMLIGLVLFLSPIWGKHSVNK